MSRLWDQITFATLSTGHTGTIAWKKPEPSRYQATLLSREIRLLLVEAAKPATISGSCTSTTLSPLALLLSFHPSSRGMRNGNLVRWSPDLSAQPATLPLTTDRIGCLRCARRGNKREDWPTVYGYFGCNLSQQLEGESSGTIS